MKLLLFMLAICAVNTSPCMAQNRKDKIFYNFPDNVFLEIELGIRTIDTSEAVVIEISESDTFFTINIINCRILPDEMRNWVQLSNRVIYSGGKEYPVFFSIDLNFVNGSYDIVGGYIIVFSKDGKVLVSKRQQ